MKIEDDLKVGDLVSVGYNQGPRCTTKYTGVITSIEKQKSLFSEKYAIMETNTYIQVLCDGEIKTFDLEEDTIGVINENR